MKLLISRPRASRAARAWSGTSRLFKGGEIDNSIHRQPWDGIKKTRDEPWWNSPWREKSKRLGISRGGLDGWRESGSRVFGSRSSSKKGWHIASIADKRWVGVYSRSAVIRSIDSWGALRKTCWAPNVSTCMRAVSSSSITGKHLVEGMWFDLRELMFHIVRIHGPDLVPSRSSKDLNDLD